jgi:hypothetical protein
MCLEPHQLVNSGRVTLTHHLALHSQRRIDRHPEALGQAHEAIECYHQAVLLNPTIRVERMCDTLAVDDPSVMAGYNRMSAP